VADGLLAAAGLAPSCGPAGVSVDTVWGPTISPSRLKKTADLRQPTAHLGVNFIRQQRVVARLRQPDPRTSLGEPGRAGLAFARDHIAVRRIELRERDRAGEARADRTDLDGDRRLEAVAGFLLERLASGDALPEYLRIVQRLPDPLPWGRKLLLSGHFHRSRRSCGRGTAG
jgi:hypothetical protein